MNIVNSGVLPEILKTPRAHVCIYIYICIYLWRQTDRQREREREGVKEISKDSQDLPEGLWTVDKLSS